jgi:hypothetical protein
MCLVHRYVPNFNIGVRVGLKCSHFWLINKKKWKWDKKKGFADWLWGVYKQWSMWPKNRKMIHLLKKANDVRKYPNLDLNCLVRTLNGSSTSLHASSSIENTWRRRVASRYKTFALFISKCWSSSEKPLRYQLPLILLRYKAVSHFQFFRDYFLVDSSQVGDRRIYNAEARL